MRTKNVERLPPGDILSSTADLSDEVGITVNNRLLSSRPSGLVTGAFLKELIMRGVWLGMAAAALVFGACSFKPAAADTVGGGTVAGDGVSINASSGHLGLGLVNFGSGLTAVVDPAGPGRYDQSIGPAGEAAIIYGSCSFGPVGGPSQPGVLLLIIVIDPMGTIHVQSLTLYDATGNVVESVSGVLTGSVTIS